MKKRWYIFMFLAINVFISSKMYSQVSANQPSDLILCDDNNDGIVLFNLTVTEPEILGSQDPTNLFFNYYNALSDANNNINPIVFPNEYYNTINPQAIFVRLENSMSGEFDVTSFNLIVNPIPITNTISNLIEVDENGDGFESFNLTVKIPEILMGQPEINVTFFESNQNAINNINVIVLPESYVNLTTPQTIYVRLESALTSCFVINEFDLVLVEALIEEEPEDLIINEGDNNGLAIFDLTVNEPIMLGDQDPLVFLFTYHISQVDAINGENNIETPSAYENVTNPQTIYVRLTNSNTEFYVITNFDIITDGVLNLEENLMSTLQLYPNPITNVFYLQSDYFSESIEIEIFNILGQVLYSEQRTPINNTIIIDSFNFLKNIYFVKVSSENHTVIKKVIKN